MNQLMLASSEPRYSPPTRVIINLVDPEFDRGVPADVNLTDDQIETTLQSNKFSRELLEDSPYETDGATNDRARRRAREERMYSVVAELNEAGSRYALMKNLRGPKIMMSDIDLLVPEPSSVGQVILTLDNLEYDFYQFRLLAHPLKIMAKQEETGTRPVDIYPDAIWMRKIVSDAEMVVDRASTGELRLPAPEDDLYLVATHSYSHLNIRFADIYHGARCLESSTDFNWKYIVDMARDYGCADAMIVYLRLLDSHLAMTDRQRVPEMVFDKLSSGIVPRLAQRWVDAISPPVSYPIEIPVWLANVASSVYHTPKIVHREGVYKAYKDLQSHYLSLSSKILLGET